jgi:hypothetical protein
MGMRARPSREVDRGRHDSCGFAANPAFNCRIIIPALLALVLSGCSPPANVPPRHRNDPPTVRSDASWMAAPHQGDAGSPASGPAVVPPASMRADKAPNHPIRVRTAHLGCAHAGRHRACWVKGARSWRTPRGQGRHRGLPLRLSIAWRARWHDGCCRPDRSVQHPRAGPGEVARATLRGLAGAEPLHRGAPRSVPLTAVARRSS